MRETGVDWAGGILLAFPERAEIPHEGTQIAMFSRVRIAIRFFFVGLAVGVLLAPRSGEETRRMLRERADRLLNDILDAASLGAGGGASAPGTTPEEEATAPRTSRSSNGSGTSSSRSRKASTASESETEAEATSAGA